MPQYLASSTIDIQMCRLTISLLLASFAPRCLPPRRFPSSLLPCKLLRLSLLVLGTLLGLGLLPRRFGLPALLHQLQPCQICPRFISLALSMELLVTLLGLLCLNR